MNIKQFLFKHFEKGVVAIVVVFVIVRTIMTIRGGQLTVPKPQVYAVISRINEARNRTVDTKPIEEQVQKDMKQLSEIIAAINGLKAPLPLEGVGIFWPKRVIPRGEIRIQANKTETFEPGVELTAIQVDNKEIASVELVPPDKFSVKALAAGSAKVRATTKDDDTFLYDLEITKEPPKKKEAIFPVENLDVSVDVGRVTLTWERGKGSSDINVKRIVPEEYLIQRVEGLAKPFGKDSTIAVVPAVEKRKAQTATAAGIGEGTGAGGGAEAGTAPDKTGSEAAGGGKTTPKSEKTAPAAKTDDFIMYELPQLTYDDTNVEPDATYRYRVIPRGKDSKGETCQPRDEEIKSKVAVVPSNIRIQFVSCIADRGVFRVVATLTYKDLKDTFKRGKFRKDEKQTFEGNFLTPPGMTIGKPMRITDAKQNLTGTCERFRTPFMLVDIVPTDRITTEPVRRRIKEGDHQIDVETVQYRKTKTQKAIVVNIERNESRELMLERVGEVAKREPPSKTTEKAEKTEESTEETKESEKPAETTGKRETAPPTAPPTGTGGQNQPPPQQGGTGVTAPAPTPSGTEGGTGGEIKPGEKKKHKKPH